MSSKATYFTERTSGATSTERASDAPSAEPADDATAKGLILRLVQALPEDNSYDEILRELAFARMVMRGLADADEDRKVDADELRERVRQWPG